MANFNFPDVGAPFIDLETGLVNPVWYMFLARLFQANGAGKALLDAGQLQALVSLQRAAPNLSDVTNAVNEARALLGAARNDRSTITQVQAKLDEIQALLVAAGRKDAAVDDLRRAVADLSVLVMAMQRRDSAIEDLRRDINELKALNQQPRYAASIRRLEARLSDLETLTLAKR